MHEAAVLVDKWDREAPDGSCKGYLEVLNSLPLSKEEGRAELEHACMRRYCRSFLTPAEYASHLRQERLMTVLTMTGSVLLPGIAFLSTLRQQWYPRIFFATGAFVLAVAFVGTSQRRMQEAMISKYLKRFSTEELQRLDEVLLDRALADLNPS